MDNQSYHVQHIGQVELEQQITFKELPIMRSEFHQHFEAGATVQRIYQQVSGEEVKAAMKSVLADVWKGEYLEPVSERG